MLCATKLGALFCIQTSGERCSFSHRKILEIGRSLDFVKKKNINFYRQRTQRLKRSITYSPNNELPNYWRPPKILKFTFFPNKVKRMSKLEKGGKRGLLSLNSIAD